MNEIDVNQLVSQMRLLAAQAKPVGPAEDENASAVEFSDLLKQSVDSVNENQQKASAMRTAFDVGTGDASLAEVMVSVQKASVSFQAITQVRNKLVSAYQEVMSMQV